MEAVFGAPLSLAGHERAAVKAAIDMRTRLEALNKTLQAQGYQGLKHGIGIHTGQVLAANIGARERIAYSLIGDTVNTASRIQDMNKKFKTDILVSKDIVQNAGRGVEFVQMPGVRLKGKTKKVTLFSVIKASTKTSALSALAPNPFCSFQA
ncbi:MAG: adenylate/guanylate cyclase domain-containing protein [Desulfobacter sp.]|nr:adenylate/guanylate cyclase domain-containing protein [Desulfobacter sp.]WDP88031.1 MAG: adenylate/guanylate cyclase domain-containing protein [Desulfobacter sp.]